MKNTQNKRALALLMFLVCCLVMAAPQRLEAAAWTGQETKMPLLDSRIGRYQMNYTGNTNHYAYWDSKGTAPLKNTNRIYNDVPNYMNSSTAALKKTSGATGIKYAYLVWETRAPEGATAPVRFIAPGGQTYNIFPTYAINDWREDTVSQSWAYKSLYCMATDVTAIVQSAGYGNYSVCNIPRYNGGAGGGESPGSWQLIVVEEGDDFPVRAVCLTMGSEFRMSEDYSGELALTSGLKSKITGAASGQVFFGASNSSSNAPMTENITTYTGDGAPIRQAVSHTTTSPGLYKNGSLVNGRDSGNGCIRMSLSNVSDIGNGAEKIGLNVENESWSSFFFLGLAMDIAYPDFKGEQTTTVNSASSVTLTGTFTNIAAIQNTGIYNGNLVVELDSGLSPVSASAVVNGTTTVGGAISGQKVIFSGPEVASMMNGSSISYTIACTTGNAGKTVFHNNAGFHGYLRSDGVNTGYWIDRMWTASSSAVPKYTLILNAGIGIENVIGGGDYAYGTTVRPSAVLKPGYHWKDWTGSNPSSQQNPSFSMPAKNVSMTANGEANVYTVRYDGNGSDGGSMADSLHTFDTAKNLTVNSYTKTGYTFTGWNRNSDGNGEGFSDGQSVKNLTTENGGIVTLYAQWRPNQYTIIFDPNGGIGQMDDIQTQYDEEVALPNGADGYRKYTLDGANVTDAVISGNYTFSVFGEEMEEKETAETTEAVENVIEDSNDLKEQTENQEEQTENQEEAGYEEITEPEGTEEPTEEDGMNQEGAAALPEEAEGTEEAAERSAPVPKAYPSVFMGWSLEDGKSGWIPQWKAGDTVKNLTAEENGAVILYAVWDDCPWIQAEDRYYSLEQAQNGFITELEILRHAAASDREDGSPIEPGFHDNGTSFSIPDYQPEDFTQFKHEGSVTENLTVVDSVGSVYKKQITVHIVDTTPTVVKPEGTTRFINEKYYNLPYEEGGLEENSIWKTDPEYKALLEDTFRRIHEDNPIEVYEFSHEDILEMKKFVEENGIGNSKRANALSDFYEKFLVPNRTK